MLLTTRALTAWKSLDGGPPTLCYDENRRCAAPGAPHKHAPAARGGTARATGRPRPQRHLPVLQTLNPNPT